MDSKKTNIRSTLKEPYPNNLLIVINDSCKKIPINDVTWDIKAGLAHILTSLSERDQKIISLRYRERKTLKKIAEQLGVTPERIRSLENKAIMRLRHPRSLGYIIFGKKGYEKLVEERKIARERENKQCILQITLEELDLSVRSFNCLKKKNYNTINDIAGLSEDEILSIRNLGGRSIVEIAETLYKLGVYDTTWEKFLSKEKKECYT